MSPADLRWRLGHSACRRRDCRHRFARRTARCSIKNKCHLHQPGVLIDRAERGLRKMVKDETHDRLTSTVSFWSSIGFYSLCSSSMLLVNKMVLDRPLLYFIFYIAGGFLYFLQSRVQQLCGSPEFMSYSAGTFTRRGVRTKIKNGTSVSGL